jgi:hypothetical protein
MLNLRSATRKILENVEETTGKSIQLMQEDDLPVLATLVTARNGASFHILRYKATNEPIDYLIAYQAGFLLRLFENPPDKRFDFAPDLKAWEKAKALIIANGNPKVDSAMLEAFSAHIAQWALMSLRSVPVGMRVDQWIRRNYPDLHDQQDASIALQQQQNVASLAMNLGGMTVPSTLIGTYAAYAMFTDDLTGQNTYAIPYIASGLGKVGRDLMDHWRKIPESAEHDCDLIDSWAHLLGVKSWYTWSPYQP